MPRVSFKDFTIRGQLVRIEIGYNSKQKFHAIKFDQAVIDTLSLGTTHYSQNSIFGYDTEAALIKFLHEQLDKYHTIISKRKKVIIYSVIASDAIIEFYAKDGFGTTTKKWAKGKKIENRGDMDEFIFGVKFKVAFCVEGDGVEYYEARTERTPDFIGDKEVGHSTRLDPDEMVIDWTQEREEAFKNICDSLSNTAKKAILILSDQDKAIQLLESKQKLLK